jgi:uncharacterized membrane protein
VAVAHPRTDDRHGAFGQDAFGRAAEKTARFFGTPQYILGQSAVVVAWIIVNALAVSFRWDPYPFILLNLAFSTQAAYAAPLILLAQTRQADRDKQLDERVEHRHDEMEHRAESRVEAIRAETARLEQLLESNTDLTRQDKELTEQVADLTKQIHGLLTATPPPASAPPS